VRDSKRPTVKSPFSPATQGLKNIMEKLGGVNKRHEDLVRRVDELEASLSSCSVDNRFSCRSDSLIILRGLRKKDKIRMSLLSFFYLWCDQDTGA